MSLSNTQYDTIFRIYQKRQILSRHLLDDRTREVYERIPDYRDLEESVATLSVSFAKKLLEGEDTVLTKLHQSINDLTVSKNKLLLQAGFPADYLTPVYECSDCRDTGYLENGQKCHCFKQAITALLYEQSNIQNLLLTENFSKLTYDYHTGKDLGHFQKAVALSRSFIDSFHTQYTNLLFYGTPGTGKSFLSSCIAKELLDNGVCVIYFSAARLFDTLAQNTYNFNAREALQEMHDDIYQCDLLIVDDLGTENPTAFVSSQLFACVNERHLRRRPTIISTNLSIQELQNRYSERLVSRFMSDYQICLFSCPDIRIQKKMAHQ